jgi:hypothetical protein
LLIKKRSGRIILDRAASEFLRRRTVGTKDTYNSVGSSAQSAAYVSNFSTVASTTTISDRNGLDALWLFELKDDGTVIYARPQLAGHDGRDGLEGHNFFDETFGFDDIAEYRQHFKSFVKSNKAVAKFVWRRKAAGKSVDTKVLMTRVFQSGASQPTGAVMMEIRGCTN